MNAIACECCGTTERPVQRSCELAVTLCGLCFEAKADSATTAPLLAAVEEFAARYCVLPGSSEETAHALWVLHTHALEGAHATPYLLYLSPEKRSGKTRAQEVDELLVACPWRVTSASEAAIFRKISKDRPTLLLDEIDAIFGSFSERTEPLRAILNAGNRPGATVARCVGEKGDQVREFPIYCAKALAGIDTGRLPDTIRDRGIKIAMRRRTAAEPVERLRWRDAKAEAEPLRARLTEWAEQMADRLLGAEPSIPLELDDRAAEAWEPLLAIADRAGGKWPQRAREAAIALSQECDEPALGSVLLAAIRQALGEADRMRTTDLLERINADEELPFGGWRDGGGLDPRGLARMLRPYRIRPRSIRIGDDPSGKGYLREQFRDAWERWLPDRTEAALAAQAARDTPGVTATARGQVDVPHVPGVPGGVPDEAGV
jgi:hypothetical protein